MMDLEPAYRYRAACERVIDGDTFVARIDLGFYVAVSLHIRIAGINAPERTKPGGVEASAYLKELLAVPLLIESHKDARSFERWVCDAWTEQGSVADLMVQAGHAVRVV